MLSLQTGHGTLIGVIFGIWASFRGIGNTPNGSGLTTGVDCQWPKKACKQLRSWESSELLHSELRPLHHCVSPPLPRGVSHFWAEILPKNRQLAPRNTRRSCKHDGNLRRWQSAKDRNVAGVAIRPLSSAQVRNRAGWSLSGHWRGWGTDPSGKAAEPLPRAS